MIRAQSIAAFLLAVIGPTVLFWMVIHQVSGLWLDVALRPEVRQALQQSMEDQKQLRSLDAAHRDAYRKRFETTSTLLHRLDVIRMNRTQMLRRFEITVVAIFALVAIVVAASVTMRARRARALEQKQYLDRVAVLQENARRHAHETKGPLTAARLELERAGDALRGAHHDELAGALHSIGEEIDRLSQLTRNQASFAAIGDPVLRAVSLRTVVEEFCATFANAWPNVTLRCSGGDATVCADRDMLRQVLVNLCTNSALAIDGEGSVTFAISKRAIEVTDTGHGVPESLRARLFDPYVTTRKTGEGMGLGLAISRKIMLDHGGDLQLAATSGAGTTFRLLFGETECS
jgi:signal transduction histidine kinase